MGEAPGKTEARTGIPFVGRSGKLLDRALKSLGVDREDLLITNVALCHPPENKKPGVKIIRACAENRLAQELAGKRVLALGATAVKTLVGDDIRMADANTQTFELPNMTVVGCYHPAYILRNPNARKKFMRAIKRWVSPEDVVLETNVIILEKEDDIIDFCQELSEHEGMFVFDLETEGLHPWMGGRILSISFTLEAGTSYVIPGTMLLFCAQWINEALRNTKLKAYGHNVAFDVRWLEHFGIYPADGDYTDTMLLHYLLDENSRHGLKYIVGEALGVANWGEKAEKAFKLYEKRKVKEPDVKLFDCGITEAELLDYNGRDTDYNFRIAGALEKACAKQKVDRHYNLILRPCQMLYSDIETDGIRVDVGKLDSLYIEYEKKLGDREVDLAKLVGRPLNPRSPKQVLEYIQKELGLRKVENTQADTLKSLHSRYPHARPFFDILFDCRALSKIIGTYIKGIKKVLDFQGRIHPGFMLHATATGRLVAGIMLTIPKPFINKFAGPIRDLFIADQGKVFVVYDYSQAELRVITCEAQEESWREVYLHDGDLHSAMAAKIYGDNFTKEQRYITKNANFGFLYGMAARKFVEQLALHGTFITIDEAQTFHDEYFDHIPNIVQWKKLQEWNVKNLGYVVGPFGQRRRFPGFKHLGFRQQQDALRQAGNFPIQNGANALTMKAASVAYEDGMDVKLTVHDEIIVQCRIEEVNSTRDRLKEIMERVPREIYSDYVPFSADGNIGESWGAAK